jgi:nitrate reductase gamma subunit
MMDQIWYFVMVPMVYLSVAWCIIWIFIRILGALSASNRPTTLKIFYEGAHSKGTSGAGTLAALWDTFAMSSVRKYQPLLWIFLIVFHSAALVLFIAHLDLLPQINVISPQSAHMIGNGAIGVIITLSLLYFMFRRLRSPVREVSVPSDFLLLFLLLALAISGSIISWGNSWTDNGFVISKQDFGSYLETLLAFRLTDPREFLHGSHYPIIGTHVLFANVFLLVLPFSKIMHVFFALPMNKLRRG